MKNKDLIKLLLMPFMSLIIAVSGIMLVEMLNESNERHHDIASNTNNFLKKLKAESAEETQQNILYYIKNTQVLLYKNLEGEKANLASLRNLFVLTALAVFVWLITAFLIFNKIKKRMNNENL